MNRGVTPKKIINDLKIVNVKDLVITCKKCGDSIGPQRKIQKIKKLLTKGDNAHLIETLYLCGKCKSLF